MEVENKKKILIVIFQNLNKGGVEEYLYNMFTQLSNKFDFTVLVPGEIKSQYNKERYEKLGVKVVALHCTQRKYIRRIQLLFRLKKFLKNNQFDVIHTNSGAHELQIITNGLALKNNIKCRIAHSHSAKQNIGFLKKSIFKICTYFINNMVSLKLACSEMAGKEMFNKLDDVKIVKNGIDVEKYKFNINTRKKIRQKLNLEGKFVIGCVANFQKVKNHQFLIKVFCELQKYNKNAILLLIGDGELKNEIKEQVRRYNLDNRVIFYGSSNDVNILLQGMDIFVLCSLFEGIPMSIIEAQTSGLQCILSNNISSEVNISGLCSFMPLNNNAQMWTQKIEESSSKKIIRENIGERISQKGYDIHDCFNIIEKIYQKGNI